MSKPDSSSIPYGYCHCGCGKSTKIALRTHRPKGWIKGEPLRYIQGHHLRKNPAEYVVQDAGYVSSCWIWCRSRSNKGYGRQYYEGEVQLAHRVAWQRAYGSIPEEKWVLHKCDVRACVNPEHLFLGTSDDNIADMVNKERSTIGERNPNSKLSWDRALEIRNEDGLHKDIAARHGVSRATVGYIKANKTWKQKSQYGPLGG